MELTSTKRQKIQLELAFPRDGGGEPSSPLGEGTEVLVADRVPQSPECSEPLMEEVVERENLKQALKRVQSNQGGPGVDKMTVDALPAHLKVHWRTIREQLLQGTYRPQPVKRVEIPKSGGGVRKLGIPTVLDRFVQQAVLQVLQRRWAELPGVTVHDIGRVRCGIVDDHSDPLALELHRTHGPGDRVGFRLGPTAVLGNAELDAISRH